MKIAMVSAQANPHIDSHSQAAHVTELSAALSRHGHEVVVYTRRDQPDQHPTSCGSDGYPVIHLPAGPARRMPAAQLLGHLKDFATRLAHHVQTDHPDVIHSHGWISGFVSVLVARTYGIPTVHTYHTLGVATPHPEAADTSSPDRVSIEQAIGHAATRILSTNTAEITALTKWASRAAKSPSPPAGSTRPGSPQTAPAPPDVPPCAASSALAGSSPTKGSTT